MVAVKYAVLAGAGLGDHARLAHAARQQRLADDVVHLVRAGVVQVFALEVDLRAAAMLGQAAGMVDGRRTADEMLQLVLVFLDEFGIVLIARIGIAQLVQRVGQRFRNEGAAVRAEVAVGVGQVVHGNLSRHPPGSGQGPAGGDIQEGANRERPANVAQACTDAPRAASASRTARTNAVMRARSFTPRAASIPLLTSTA